MFFFISFPTLTQIFSPTGTGALLNAASDEAGTDINYIIDEDALITSVVEVGANLTAVDSMNNMPSLEVEFF